MRRPAFMSGADRYPGTPAIPAPYKLAGKSSRDRLLAILAGLRICRFRAHFCKTARCGSSEHTREVIARVQRDGTCWAVAQSGRVIQRCGSACRRGRRPRRMWSAVLRRSCVWPRIDGSPVWPSNPDSRQPVTGPTTRLTVSMLRRM